MKKLMWAALLALPALVAGQEKAVAGGICWNIQGCYKLKIWAGASFCCSHGCGSGGCCPGGNCSGEVPGPWYTYWPNGGGGMTSPYATEGWVYDMNFQLPAPVYPYWPAGAGQAQAAPFSAAGFQPAGYYPSYWYGR